MNRLWTAVGLMSGTSGDGIDAALLKTDGLAAAKPLHAVTIPYEPQFRRSLLQAARQEMALGPLKELELRLTELHGAAVRQLCEEAAVDLGQVDLVGFHGHTIAHQPERGRTHQLGDGPALAAQLGCRVIFDYRSADLSAGGEGAPLAPLFHRAMLNDRGGTHLVLNLGGVGNVTWISGSQLAAGDTGPGCGLLDLWTQRHTGEPFDRDGRLAANGEADMAWVRESLSQHPYFARSFPKSADRFDFNSLNLDAHSPEDGAATLCALTVEAVAQAVRRLKEWPDCCWVTGGGRHHPVLMRRLEEHFPRVAPVSELGYSEDFLEASCFAWLGVRRLLGLPTTLPQTTGAQGPVCGGRIVSPEGVDL